MATVLPARLLRGTSAQNAAVTLPEGVQVYLTDTKNIAVHDGTTPGGVPAADFDGGAVSSPILAPVGLGYAFDGDPDTGLSRTAANKVSMVTGGHERLQCSDTAFLAAIGDALYPAFFPRAWVNFNGVGTVSVRASGNVSGITDNGSGLYRMNFTVAMPDANYAVAGFASNNDTGANESFTVSCNNDSGVFTASYCNFTTTENTASATTRSDSPLITLIAIR